MAPLTHLLASWIIASQGTDNPRDCRLVALAGILPDADGLGLIIDLANQALGHRAPQLYARYHHYLLHGGFGALLIAAVLCGFAVRRWRVAVLALLVFHLHLLCDFVRSRGPSPEDLWPIFYYGPFDKDPMWIWKGQWPLDAWRNRLLTLALFWWALWLSLPRGYSFVGVFSRKADNIFMGVIRKWHTQLTTRTRTGKP